MTKVTVWYEGKRIVRLRCVGHAGVLPQGENIVCAAVSILMQNCVNAMEKVAGVTPLVSADANMALISVEMPPAAPPQDHDAQIVLHTTVVGLSDISQAYPNLVSLQIINGRNKP